LGRACSSSPSRTYRRLAPSRSTCANTNSCCDRLAKEEIMQENTLLESSLRQLKLPTFAQNYAAFAQDAARTGLSCERYLLARGEAELTQRDAHRVERCTPQARLPVPQEPSQLDRSCVPGASKPRVLQLPQG